MRYVATVATALLVAFFSVLLILYFRGFHGDCGCFGPGEQLGPKTLARDGALVLLSVWVTWEAFRRNRGRYNIDIRCNRPVCLLMQNSESLRLKFGLSFEDLYRREGLLRIDAAIYRSLESRGRGLLRRLTDAREHNRAAQAAVGIDGRSGAACRGFHRRAVRHRRRSARPAGAPRRAGAALCAEAEIRSEESHQRRHRGAGQRDQWTSRRRGAGSAVQRAADRGKFRRARLALAGR